MAKEINLLIEGAKALNRSISTFSVMYTKVHTKAHVLLVSAIVHAAAHGDADPLSRFFNALATNDKEAARSFIRRVSAVTGGWNGVAVVDQDVMNAFKKAGSFLTATVKDGATTFGVIQNEDAENAADNKAAVVKMTDRMLNPDGLIFTLFLDRNNFAEVKLFGLDELQAGIARLLKQAKGDKKNTKSNIEPKYLEALVAAQKVIGVRETSVAA